MKPFPELTARQRRAVDQLDQLQLGSALTEHDLGTRVWNLEWDELEFLYELGLVCRRRSRAGMLYWLSACGRRYAAGLHEEIESGAAGRQGAPELALQGPSGSAGCRDAQGAHNA